MNVKGGQENQRLCLSSKLGADPAIERLFWGELLEELALGTHAPHGLRRSILETHIMKRRHFYRPLVAALSVGLPGFAALAESPFPNRPVRVVVPFAPGNTLDSALRLVAEPFRQSTGQQLIVDSKPGGGGVIAATNVAHAPADGYTLLLGSSSILAINPHIYKKLAYDPEKSFRSVTNFVGGVMVFAVNAQVPANNVKEFVAWAKTRPGKVSFASFTAGNPSHFAGVILNQRAGLDMVHVPYNGTPPAVTGLLAGDVDAAFLPLFAVQQYLQNGRLRALAVSSPGRTEQLPQVASFQEQGFPELSIYIWASLNAPAGTPDAVIARLNSVFVEALRSSDIRQKLLGIGFEALPTSPQELDTLIRAESKRWGEAVRVSGFKASE
jgi:tripartite-type tricarboxylate transporter receptor subunit TctC